jgi:hypothetical protein
VKKTPKKSAKLIVVVILVLFAFGVFFNLYILFAWPKYENEKYGFVWYYPKGWTLTKEDVNRAAATLSPSSTTCSAYGFKNELINDKDQPQTLDEFMEWLFQSDETKIIKKTNTKLGGEDAKEAIWEDANGAHWGIYILNNEIGRAIICSFDKLLALKSNNLNFTLMKLRFKLTEPKTGAGKIQYRNRFLDSSYNEVATTPREDWDKTKLPTDVLDYQNKGYTCYPSPFKFDSEGSVTQIEWVCEK